MPELIAPTEAEVRAFIGPRADKYWRRWSWYIHAGTQRAGTLWPPFFFNFIWFLYRRMYAELWVPIALGVGVSLVQAVYESVQQSKYGEAWSTPRGLDTVINVGVAVLTSWLGSYLYLRKLRKAVAASREFALQSSEEEGLALLARRGGTSALAGAIGAAIAIVLLVASLAG